MNMNIGDEQIAELARKTGLSEAQIRASFVGNAQNGQPVFNLPPGLLGGMSGQPQTPGDRLQQLLDKANAANEERYQQLLQGADANKAETLGALQGSYNRMTGLTGTWLDAALKREGMNLQEQVGDMQGSLTSRGLGNTTILDSFKLKAQDLSALRGMELQGMANKERLGVEQQYMGAYANAISDANKLKLGFIEGRNDLGPDAQLYAALLGHPGNAGGFSSFGMPQMGGGYVGGGVAGGAAPADSPFAGWNGGERHGGPLYAPNGSGMASRSPRDNPYGPGVAQFPNQTFPIPGGGAATWRGPATPDGGGGWQRTKMRGGTDDSAMAGGGPHPLPGSNRMPAHTWGGQQIGGRGWQPGSYTPGYQQSRLPPSWIRRRP